VLGCFLAAADGSFQIDVALLCVATAVLLQVLSNLANDYGDTVHGADSEHRQGPKRATQSGTISLNNMRIALIIFVGLALFVGYLLIRGEHLVYYLLGIAAITAAIAYTAGPKPYGYAGLGDIFVFLFFGLVGVGGTYYLHTHVLNYYVLLPASACGFLSVAVLNINNIRDIDSDRMAGKYTIPVRIGAAKAKQYHIFLLSAALFCAVLSVTIDFRSWWQFLFMIALPLLLKNGVGIRCSQPAALDPYLKQMSITTLVFTLSFGIGMLF
jgi:1,4-dihydroxy-2-naphthoate octaprenyltransferase